MPSKVYEALAAAVPFIVTAGCEAEQLVRRYDVGRVFAPGDGDALARAVEELASDPALRDSISANAVDLAQRFDRSRIASRTERLLLAIANGERLPDVEW